MPQTSLLLAVGLGILLLLSVPYPAAEAKGGVVSGNVNYVVSDPNGTSTYTVLYSYPANVTEGTSLNVTVSLEVDGLTGLKLYLVEYSVSVTVSTTSGTTVTRLVNSTSPWLNPGSHWGPEELSLPVAPNEFKVPPGASIQANVSIAIGTEVWWDQPYNFHYPESASSTAGNVEIIGASVQSPNYPAFFATVVAGAAIAVGAAFAWDQRKGIRNKPRSSS
ncbi:MAG TPA: hypothetical protein VGR53_01535 [Nitrososphaerales archaeon]|nr:hypothetical protein [Nitrososphaerales archaeon]